MVFGDNLFSFRENPFTQRGRGDIDDTHRSDVVVLQLLGTQQKLYLEKSSCGYHSRIIIINHHNVRSLVFSFQLSGFE